MNVQRPDLTLECPEMFWNEWLSHELSFIIVKIIYESNLSWLNTIILSEKICIRNHGYNFWARNFIGKIIDPLCQLFSIWLWNQAWFDALSGMSGTDRPWTGNKRPTQTCSREIQLIKSYGLSYKDSMLIIYSIILDHLAAENEANWVRQMISNTEIHGTLIKHIRQFLK